MNSKSGYNGAYFQEIYNKQNDSRLIKKLHSSFFLQNLLIFYSKVKLPVKCPNRCNNTT